MENRTAVSILVEKLEIYLPLNGMSNKIIQFYIKEAIDYEIAIRETYYLLGIKEHLMHEENWRSFNENPKCNGKEEWNVYGK